MKEYIENNNGAVSIIAILLVIIVILIAILAIRVFNDKNSPKSGNYDYSSKSDYSKDDIISLLEKGENYNNFSCEYQSDEENGNMVRKFKNNVLIIKTNIQTVYQNYNNDKQIVITPDKKIALNTTISNNKLIAMNKNYAKGLSDLIKKDNIKYQYLKEERYNNLDCVVIRIEGTEQLNNIFSFDKSFSNYNYLNVTMDIWISKKSGLVAKISGNSETDTNQTFSKTIDYHLVLDNVTDDDIKEPDLTGYTVTNI